MSSAKRNVTVDAGFTLVEVLIAMMLLTVIALGVTQLSAIAICRNVAARHQTSTTVLAQQKLEQLRALTFGYDGDAGLPVTDTTTDLTTEPASGSGSGLSPSPSNTLTANTPGYADYLDSRGSWVGTGGTPPPTALYVRRWNVSRLASHPEDTLILQVLVTTVKRDREAGTPSQRIRAADEALVTTLKTRTRK